METKISGEPRNKVDLDRIVYKLSKGDVVTVVVPEIRLDLMLSAASKTGFKVTEIARDGERFPVNIVRFSPEQALYARFTGGSRYHSPALNQAVVKGKGYIAVAVEKPQDTKGDYAPFWKELKRLEQEKASGLPRK